MRTRGKPRRESRPRAWQVCLARRRNPEFDAGDGVFARKTQNTVSGISGILVFWYSGLALAETRSLSWAAAFLRQKSRIPVGGFRYSGPALRTMRFGGAGIVCSWHVARGGLDFWLKNAGIRLPECQVPWVMRGKRAKQTQFPVGGIPRHSRIPLSQHSNRMPATPAFGMTTQGERKVIQLLRPPCHCERSAAFGRNQKHETTKSTKDTKE